ncbi:MAG TPA: MFS transporter [Planctomycetaceae bacterium]|nr:MFS transporter [Planctomycetaceae bacterium]
MTTVLTPSSLPTLADAPQPDRADTLRSDLAAMTLDGVSFSVMVGLGETYLAAFLLALGKSELAAGLVGTLPMLAGAVLQFVTPRAVARLGSCRRWVVWCATVQALSFLPLALAAWAGAIPTPVVFLIAAVYWGTGMATGPAWNAWVETLVPVHIRARYFARRTRAAQIGVFAGLVGAGVALQTGRSEGHVLTVFAAMFVGAMLARLFSAACLARQSEPHPPQRRHAPHGDGVRGTASAALALISRHFTGPNGRLLRYLLLMQIGVQIAGPYFTCYMLEHLHLSYGQYVGLLSMSFVSKIAVLPALGSFARRAGARRLLWLGAVGVVPLPALWLVSDSFWYLLAVQMIGGLAWAAHELAMLLLFFETIPRQERTGVLTVFNFANAAAMAAGTLVGAALLGALGEERGTYLLLFALSAAARTVPLAFLVRLPERVAAFAPIAMRILAVRPSSGSMERPVLPSIPELPHEPEAESQPRESDATGIRERRL